MSRRSQSVKQAPVDAASIFRTADAYHNACGRLSLAIKGEAPLEKINSTGDPSFIIPAMMLSAFSSELYFKCIYAFENNGRKTFHHDLLELFKQCSQAMKNTICERWEVRVVNSEQTRQIKTLEPSYDPVLKTCLTEARETFERLRYYYETRFAFSPFRLGELPMVLREAIFEVKPEYLQLTPLIQNYFPGPEGESKPPRTFAENIGSSTLTKR